MKSNLFFAAIAACFLLFACGDDEGNDPGATVEIDARETFHLKMDDVTAFGPTLTFDLSDELSGHSDPEFNINQIYFGVNNYTGQASNITVKLQVVGNSATVTSASQVIANINNDPSGVNISLSDNSFFNIINSDLEDDNKVRITISGSLDAKPSEFDLVVRLKGTAK
ncbi:hypothetical protein [Fulvivirga ligni]|uniref:hypothetical protein n=1 Tax=Fulvivirga ligni TaxID=2904246 RepID=UPI001F1B0AB6|nr:hypothetical protein [Fulvivirga ligni]UII20367.1 hypothetical protein LVD16_21220 [Fulvivirga ligni]